MKITGLSIQGFRAFKTRQRLEIGTLLNGLIWISGINEVEPELGSNGAGKSSIFEALFWILFGKTSRNLKAGSIVNWSGNHKCIGNLEFELNEVNCILSRTQSPNGIFLQRNGVEIETITQEYLETFLGINFASFSYAVFVPQFVESFFSLTPGKRLQVFAEIMADEMKPWEAMLEKTKLEVKKGDIEYTQAFNVLSKHKGAFEQLQKQDFTKDSQTWNENQIKKIAVMEERKRILSTETEMVNKDYTKAKKEEVEVTKLFNELRKTYLEKEAKSKALDLEIEGLNKKIWGNEHWRTQHLSEVSKMKDFKETVCPTCKQKVDRELLKSEVKTHEDEVKKCDICLKEDREAHKQKYEEKVNLKLSELDSRLRKLENEKGSFKVMFTNFDRRLLQIGEDVKAYTDQISKSEKETNPFTALILAQDKELLEIQDKIDLAEADVLEIDKKLMILKYWKNEGIKKIKLELMLEALKEMEVSVNSYLQLMGMGTWSIILESGKENKDGTLKEEFSVLVKSPETTEYVPWECYSGGENGRLLLAGTFGIMDLIQGRKQTQWNVEFWDEPTRWLSAKGIQALLQILKTRATEDGKKIFIIDHADFENQGIFDSIIEVRKTREGSIINV